MITKDDLNKQYYLNTFISIRTYICQYYLNTFFNNDLPQSTKPRSTPQAKIGINLFLISKYKHIEIVLDETY